MSLVGGLPWRSEHVVGYRLRMLLVWRYCPHAPSSTAVFWLECPDADGMPSLLHGVAAWDGLGAAVLLCLLTVVIRGPLEGGAS
jgi:hypothetical protein